VEALCDKLFSCSAFANYQNGTIQRRSAACAFYRIQKCRRLANKLNVIPIHFQTLAYFTIEWQ
jgi:hypothetical protein